MFRSAVYVFVLASLAQLVLSHSVELDEQSGVFSILRGVGTGKSSVWQTFDGSHQLSKRKTRQESNGNHFQNGWKSPGSVLMHREVVKSSTPHTMFNHQTSGIITYVEAQDQNNGSGGFVSSVFGGLHETFVNVQFSLAKDAVPSIDFIVEIWGRPSQSKTVPAADFRIGELTDRSAWDLSYRFNHSATAHETLTMAWKMFGNPDKIFTYIEAFDLSSNGNGGLVQLIDGGIGQSFFQLGLRSVAPGAALNLTIVAYSVDELNGGQNFRLGTWKPGMQTLASKLLEERARPNEVLTSSYSYSNPSSTIEFVQGWDLVPRGTGGLVALAGGLGYSNMSLTVNSGRGENLSVYVSVYGRR